MHVVLYGVRADEMVNLVLMCEEIRQQDCRWNKN